MSQTLTVPGNSKCILNPLQFGTLYRYHIKTSAGVGGVMLQIVQGGEAEFFLLFCGDAGGGTTKQIVAAAAHFNKHQVLAVLHHQINFTQTAAVIFLQQAQTLLLQMIAGTLFGELAVMGRGCGHGCW